MKKWRKWTGLLGVSVSLVLHLHDLDHEEVDGLLGLGNGKHSIHHNLNRGGQREKQG